MTDSNRTIFNGMQILHGHTWVKDHALVVEDQVIKAIIPAEMVKHHLPAQVHDYPKHHYLVPGLIDLHIHGVKDKDVMDNSQEALHTMSSALAAEGVTGFLATTMTAEQDHLEAVLHTIQVATSYQEGAAILGAHLEGPFIAAEKMGAQRHVANKIDPQIIEHWQKSTSGVIKLMTLAPELPDALLFIGKLQQLGIVAAVGHTNATYAETCAAIHAGCTYATHLFNAMRGLHQREPGAVGALLLSDKVMAELIVDGLHLHPAIVDLAFRVKGKERLLLVSDAMRAKCLGDGEYDLGGQQVSVRNGQVSLPDGTLAGSTLRLPQAIKNMVQYTRCTLAEAILMASENPATVLHLADRKGTLEVGKEADLVVMDAELDVVFTMRGGQQIWSIKK